MRRPLALGLSLLVSGTLLLGCKGKCQQLSEELCGCTLNTNEKASCLTRVATTAGNTTVTTRDDAYCATLLNACDCHTIGTPKGKLNCGLALPLPDGGIL